MEELALSQRIKSDTLAIKLVELLNDLSFNEALEVLASARTMVKSASFSYLENSKLSSTEIIQAATIKVSLFRNSLAALTN